MPRKTLRILNEFDMSFFFVVSFIMFSSASGGGSMMSSSASGSNVMRIGRLSLDDEIFDLHLLMQFIADAKPHHLPCFKTRRHLPRGEWYNSLTWLKRFMSGESRDAGKQIIRDTVKSARNLLIDLEPEHHARQRANTIELMIKMYTGIMVIVDEYDGDDNTCGFLKRTLRELRQAIPEEYWHHLPPAEVYSYSKMMRMPTIDDHLSHVPPPIFIHAAAPTSSYVAQTQHYDITTVAMPNEATASSTTQQHNSRILI